ncbi:MAG: hypothetical protein AB1641_07740 [Thermodesulfobacteriota bacterium]
MPAGWRRWGRLIAVATILLWTGQLAVPAAVEAKKRDEGVQVGFYVAVGGGCAGLILFFFFRSGLSPEEEQPRPALINYTERGWEMGLPVPLPLEKDRSGHSLEILRIDF